MKLLFENWKKYIKEESNIINSWEIIGRQFVIMNTSEGPVAFYKSTGAGAPEKVYEGDWTPFGGIVFYPGLGPWFVKIHGGHPQAENTKVLKKGSEFETIAQDLKHHPEKIASPRSLKATYEGVIEVNKILDSAGARKDSWAAAKKKGFENLFITNELVKDFEFLKGINYETST